jgi:hypothetical protein
MTKIGLLMPSVNTDAEGEFCRGIGEIGLETFDFDQFVRERERAPLSLAGS